MKNLNARFALMLEIFCSLSWIAFASATLTLIAPATLVAQTSASFVTSRIIQPVDENVRVTLKGNVRQDLATTPDLGSVEDGKPLHLYLLLQRTIAQQADLDNLIERQQQATAPEYHKWLPPKEFGARFGASPEDIAKITAWLESHGFKIRSVLNNASMIDFAATAGQVREAFHTELHDFNIRGGKHVANVQDPQIPAALAPVVAGIKGLIKIPAHTNHTKARQVAYDKETHRWHTGDTAGKARVNPAFDNPNGDLDVTPQDLYTIYNVNPVFTGGNLAATATVAVIEESDIEYGTVNPTTGLATGGDVATFRGLFGVPGTLNMHVYHGHGMVTCNDPGIDPDGIGEDQEASLDAEWINATAPSANLIFMSCDQDPDQGIDTSMPALIDNNLSDVMSLSYGESELYFTTADYSFQDTLYAQAATQGQSFFVSSGDSGSDVADQNTDGTATSGINVSAFAAPTVTVAGGTDFSDLYDSLEGGPAQSKYWAATNSMYYGDALSYIPETAWNEGCASSILAKYSGFSGAGLCAAEGAGNDGSVVGGSGGVSTHYLVPAWQTGISGYSGAYHSQPDIAGFASAAFWGHALIFCDSNPADDGEDIDCTSEADFGESGGTSFVAPYMAGVAGLLVDATGSRQGLLNPALYALAKAQYTAAATKTACYSNGQTSNAGVTTGLPAADCIFNDVTTSNNDVACEVGSTDCFVNTSESYGMLSLNGAGSLTVAYPSTIGFDQVTGIGTVNVHNLITNWNTAFTSTTGLTASPTSITSSESTELTATVTGGTPTGYEDTPPALTGTASFAAGSTSLGNCTLSAGTCMLSVPGTALQVGINSVTATFLGSGTYPTSKSSVVTVTVTSTNQVEVTVGTSPAGLSFSIDGTAYTSAQTPTWIIGSSHTIATTSPQTPVVGTQDTFTSWSDGGAISHPVTASASTTTYIALFNTQYLLTTAASPTAGGTVSPATGYQTASSSVSLVATPSAGYVFVKWTSSPGAVTNPTSASTSITMSAPESATAIFALTGPTITSISPTSKTEGGVKFTLTVNGANYVSGATVNWNGAALVTKFVNSSQLTASVPATDIATAGTVQVTVSDPSPGGTSSSATFTIDNPKPAITSLSPNSAILGGAGFTLTVKGKNFLNGSVVNWAGSVRSTIFVSATELTATINAADIAKTGTFKVTVTSPAPGGGNSAAVSFVVDNPTPTLNDLSPSSETHGGAAFTLTATGTNFVSTSKIHWNGVNLATKFVSSKTLTAVVAKSRIATAGTANVTVDTPAPGGGITAPLTFTIN